MHLTVQLLATGSSSDVTHEKQELIVKGDQNNDTHVWFLAGFRIFIIAPQTLQGI